MPVIKAMQFAGFIRDVADDADVMAFDSLAFTTFCVNVC